MTRTRGGAAPRRVRRSDGTDDGVSTAAAEGSPPPEPAAGDVREGDPPLTTEPGTARADVDDGRLDHESTGSLAHVCDNGPDRIQISFQTVKGKDLQLQALRQGDSWTGRLAFQPGGGTHLQYSATLPADAAPLEIGKDALTVPVTCP